MGCCPSAGSFPAFISPEEKVITSKELSLGYHKHSANAALKVVLQNEDGGKVSGNQFNTIAGELGLNLEEVDSLDEGMGAFYGRIKEKGKIDTLKLSILAVLLSQGDDKSSQLFDCVARNGKTELSPSDVTLLLETMIFVCAEAIPLLAKGQEGQMSPDLLSPSVVSSYISTLKSGKPALIPYLSSSLLRGRPSLTMSQFTSEFRDNSDLVPLQRPFPIRMALLRFVPEPTSRRLAGGMQQFETEFLIVNK